MLGAWGPSVHGNLGFKAWAWESKLGFLECTLEVHVSRVCGKILFTFQGCMGGFCKSLGVDPKQTLANVGPAYVDLDAMGVE